MEIVEEVMDDVLIEIINVDRATLKESEVLKPMMIKRIDEGYRKIVIDLTACEFMDSTFLGVLVNALRRVAKLGGDLRLVGFKPAVQAMFELTRLFRVFESYSDLHEAVGSFSKTN